jgi:hypothetical protein
MSHVPHPGHRVHSAVIRHVLVGVGCSEQRSTQPIVDATETSKPAGSH